MTEYVPAKVWTWDAESGGTFASINRPIAGATHEKPLPVMVVFVLLEALGCVCLLASAPVSKTFDAVANVWYRLRKK